jgi:predicted nucleotidyltransferase
MKQFKTIEIIKSIFPSVKGLQVALLYGSFGRNEANPNSDIDIQLLVDDNFRSCNLIYPLEQIFANEIQYLNEVGLRNKIVIYFKSQPKAEFGICKSIDEINRNYIGSEISDVAKTILYATDLWDRKIELYLNEIIPKKDKEKLGNYQEKYVSDLINKFVYEFENCSNMHRRSDGFQFYFFYNIALHIVVQLYQLSVGQTKFNFLPKNFLSTTLKKPHELTFQELKGSLSLPEANLQKRKLLDFFFITIKNMVSDKKQAELKEFLEWVYRRDMLWNFRDISSNNPKIQSGVVYRSSTMSLLQNEPFFPTLLSENQIRTVIDLRADREIIDLAYNEAALSAFKYVRAPFDPWNQSITFQTTYHQGSDIEIAYQFFSIECKESIKKAIETIILEQDATLIHCHAGKDRTGVFISLLHMLSEADLNVIYADYLATEMDTKKEYLDIVIDTITEKGGIVPYLLSCGLQETQVEQLKIKLLHGN